VDGIIKKVNKKTKIVFLANPNNPTGTYLDKKELHGIANMGVRPTVGGELPVLEVHLLDFSKAIYRERLTVQFLKKVRDERKFL